MSKLEKQKEKARSLEAKDPKGAIEAWQQVLKGQDEDGDPNPDLAIFNRIGDLYLKVREPAQAADYYDQAVDKYAELGFHNNAIAMCNKVLRNAPGRQTTYAKPAKRKTSSLVFLDVDAPPMGKAPATGRVPPLAAPPPKPAPPPAREPEPVPEPEAVADSLLETVTADPDTSLEIESTSLVEGLE